MGMGNQKPLHGRLEDVRFAEVILQVSHQKETGVLHIRRGPIEKHVFFQDGRVVFARSTDLDERLGEVLLRLGKVTCQHVEDAVRKAVPGQRLGTVLVQEAYISASDLYHGVIRQVEEILYDLFDWSDGEYEFRPGKLPTQEVITLNISTPDVIVKGMSRIWRSSWIMKGVGPRQNVVKRSDDWSDTIKKLSVPQKVKPMLEKLEKPIRLEDFLKVSPLNNFETCKWIWAFSIIGVIQQIPSTPPMPVKAPTAQEELDVVFDIDPVHAISAALDAVIVANPLKGTAVREASFSEMEALMDTDPALSEVLQQQTVFPVTEEAEEMLRERELRNLNEKQRFIFERLRFEMGAGVGSFLTKILKRFAGNTRFCLKVSKLTSLAN